MQARTALFALTIGAFAIGATEFSPMGLLPEIAQGVDISIPKAGLLITAYAMGVMLGAPFMTLWFSRYPQRTALIFLMFIFTIGNIFAAFAINFENLMLARLLTSLNHGAFFGIGAVVAASVVPKEKQASAVASMFMGLTIANIGGVPLATWLGQNIGWRMSFMAISILGLITILALFFALPKGKPAAKPNIKYELKVLTRPAVILALLNTVMGASAMFALYTFIAPSLNVFNHATSSQITLMLVLIGIGFSIGNHLGGKFADHSINKTLISASLILISTMLLFPFLAQHIISTSIALIVWGAASFALVPPLQMRVMAVAHDAPSLASSINIGAFNLGNAIGAAVGSLVLSLGMGYAFVSVAGAILALISLAITLLQVRLFSRNTA